MHHNHVRAIGYAIAGGGLGCLIYALIGFARAQSAGGQRLAATTADQRKGVPFADRNYYQMKRAPISAAIGVVLLIVGGVWLLVAGA